MSQISLVAEADKQIGFGHLCEIRALARAFKAGGIESAIIVIGTRPTDKGWDFGWWVPDIQSALVRLREWAPTVSVWSVRRPVPRGVRGIFRGVGGRKVWLSEQGDASPAVDLLVVPTVLGLRQEGSPGAGGILVGPPYFPLDPLYESTIVPISDRTRDVLLTLGGADRTGATLRLLPAIAGLLSTVVIGPGFRRRDELRKAASSLCVDCVEAPEGLYELLRTHRVVISAGGDTLYEAAATGTPAFVAWEDVHEKEQALAFAAAGAAKVLGQGLKLGVLSAREMIASALESPDLLSDMSQAGRRLVDGKGSRRLAEAVCELGSLGQVVSAAGDRIVPPGREIQHSKPSIGGAEMDAVMAVLSSGQLTQGPVVRRLEEEWCRQTLTENAACVGSGLGALRLSLLALGIGEGDEVIVPAYSCVALINAVLALGALPVLADIKRDDWTMSVEDVRERITERTKALVAVHLFGMPADIPALIGLGIPVIEDCAHGIGGRSGERPFGAGGMLNVASFYATKMLAGGEGGIVASSRADLIARVVQARDYSDQEPNKLHLNDKMTDMEAMLACVQLARLSEILSRRAELAARYTSVLSPLARDGLIVLPIELPGRIWYRYAVRLLFHEAGSMCQRMAAHNIRTEQPVWDLRKSRFWSGELKVASEAFERVLSLPLYPDLKDSEQEIVWETFMRCLRNH